MSNNGVPDIDTTIEELWVEATAQIANIDSATENWKAQTLPLARIKKIMKIEEGILQDMERERLAQDSNIGDMQSNKQTRFMIAGEAPVLLGKACELLIKEMSARAWRHTERNRRRTLQRQDVHAAVGESEVFDFLIDIVPRLTTASTPSATSTYAEHHMPPPPLTVPQASMAMPSMVTNAQPDMGTMGDGGLTYAIQMHPMQDPTPVPVGYEHYYMQMHQARMQAEATAPPPQMQQQQPAYVGQDAMGQWLPPPQSQPQHHHHHNGQAPGPGV
ncbi:hypothetical protein MHU86_417 [Fragilaria crotonensis]|nr:hypothetical protein MHU86_417 [Fragilaria crotonensis]